MYCLFKNLDKKGLAIHHTRSDPYGKIYNADRHQSRTNYTVPLKKQGYDPSIHTETQSRYGFDTGYSNGYGEAMLQGRYLRDAYDRDIPLPKDMAPERFYRDVSEHDRDSRWTGKRVSERPMEGKTNFSMYKPL